MAEPTADDLTRLARLAWPNGFPADVGTDASKSAAVVDDQGRTLVYVASHPLAQDAAKAALLALIDPDHKSLSESDQTNHFGIYMAARWCAKYHREAAAAKTAEAEVRQLRAQAEALASQAEWGERWLKALHEVAELVNPILPTRRGRPAIFQVDTDTAPAVREALEMLGHVFEKVEDRHA